jgi:hypothetical protein
VAQNCRQKRLAHPQIHAIINHNNDLWNRKTLAYYGRQTNECFPSAGLQHIFHLQAVVVYLFGTLSSITRKCHLASRSLKTTAWGGCQKRENTVVAQHTQPNNQPANTPNTTASQFSLENSGQSHALSRHTNPSQSQPVPTKPQEAHMKPLNFGQRRLHTRGLLAAATTFGWQSHDHSQRWYYPTTDPLTHAAAQRSKAYDSASRYKYLWHGANGTRAAKTKLAHSQIHAIINHNNDLWNRKTLALR